MQDPESELRRISIPRTPVNRGAGAWQPRLLLLFEKQLLLCQSASAAHTASSSARLSASKTTGLPSVGVCCALMDTDAERLPSPLAAAKVEANFSTTDTHPAASLCSTTTCRVEG